jgi:hypothetical protein
MRTGRKPSVAEQQVIWLRISKVVVACISRDREGVRVDETDEWMNKRNKVKSRITLPCYATVSERSRITHHTTFCAYSGGGQTRSFCPYRLSAYICQFRNGNHERHVGLFSDIIASRSDTVLKMRFCEHGSKLYVCSHDIGRFRLVSILIPLLIIDIAVSHGRTQREPHNGDTTC